MFLPGIKMKNSTAEVKGPTDEVKILSISFKAIVIIVTIFGNCLVFKAFHKFPRLRTASNSILVSLSIADSLTVIPFILHIGYIAFELGEDPHLTNVQFLCKSSARLSLVLISVIILHLVLISVERFIAIKFALRYHTIVTNRRVMAACIVAWLLAIATTLLFPPALREGSSESSYERLYKAFHPCFEDQEQTPLYGQPKIPSSTRVYLTIAILLLLVMEIIIVLCAYGYVFYVSRKHRKQIRDQSNIQGISIIKDELKGACTLAIVVGACLLSFFPLLVVTSYRFVDAPRVIRKPWLKYIAYDVALGLNACLNPMIYGWRHVELKNAFRKLLKFDYEYLD